MTFFVLFVCLCAGEAAHSVCNCHVCGVHLTRGVCKQVRRNVAMLSEIREDLSYTQQALGDDTELEPELRVQHRPPTP